MARTFLRQRIERIATGTKPQPVSRSRRLCLMLACSAISLAFTGGAVGRTATSAPDAASVAPTEVAPIFIPTEPAPVLLAETRPAPKRAHEPAPAPTQTTQSLTCSVADPSNAIVPNAPATLTNTDTNEVLHTTTDATGTCQFQNIAVGNYNLQIKAQGFKTTTQTNIHVAAGETRNAGKMLLAVGSIFESISVTGSRSAAAVTPQPPPQPDSFIKTLGPTTVLRQSPTPTPPQAKPIPAGAIRVGGNVQASKIISQTKPVYPQDALQQNVGGTVKFEAVVTKEGTLSGITLVNSPDPRLTQAALDAMKNWRYLPTLLNGEPVEVITTIDVNYEPGN